MSVTAKIVLGGACIFSTAIVAYVHYKQYLDRDQLHQGVIKDVERRQKRKAENLYLLQKQIDFTKELKKNRNENSDGVS